MPVQQIKAGAKFTIYAWGDEQSCEVLQFLEGLAADGDSDAERIANDIERTADHEAPRNEQHCRLLEDGIYEFKAPNTARVLWFYDAGRIIICTHGFSGKSGRGKTPKSEIDRAKRIRQLSLKEKKMLHVNKRETTSNRFSNLFKRLKQSDTYHIDAAKLEISEQIYLAMEQQGVSNAELARRLGKSRAYITKVLQGNVNFTIESLVKIAHALGHKFDFQFAPENQKGGAASSPSLRRMGQPYGTFRRQRPDR